MARTYLRYDRRDSEITPPLIPHVKSDQVYSVWNDQEWESSLMQYSQKYQSELIALGLRDFIRDYCLESGGDDGISIDIHRGGLSGTDYVCFIYADDQHGDIGEVTISRSTNAVIIKNTGGNGIPFHFIILERINQSS